MNIWTKHKALSSRMTIKPLLQAIVSIYWKNEIETGMSEIEHKVEVEEAALLYLEFTDGGTLSIT